MFHIFGLKIGEWIKGMHLERTIGEIFKAHPNSTISVEDAAAECIKIIDNVIALLSSPLAGALLLMVSDNLRGSVDNIRTWLGIIREDLANIQTLPDAVNQLDGFRLAEDDKRNAFYHTLLKSAATIFSDRNVSLIEASSFIEIIASFFFGK